MNETNLTRDILKKLYLQLLCNRHRPTKNIGKQKTILILFIDVVFNLQCRKKITLIVIILNVAGLCFVKIRDSYDRLLE